MGSAPPSFSLASFDSPFLHQRAGAGLGGGQRAPVLQGRGKWREACAGSEWALSVLGSWMTRCPWTSAGHFEGECHFMWHYMSLRISSCSKVLRGKSPILTLKWSRLCEAVLWKARTAMPRGFHQGVLASPAGQDVQLSSQNKKCC